jgi:hypothetical protein
MASRGPPEHTKLSNSFYRLIPTLLSWHLLERRVYWLSIDVLVASGERSQLVMIWLLLYLPGGHGGVCVWSRDLEEGDSQSCFWTLCEVLWLRILCSITPQVVRNTSVSLWNPCNSCTDLETRDWHECSLSTCGVDDWNPSSVLYVNKSSPLSVP